MKAGSSAQSIATSADSVAAWASRRAARFARGAAGEGAVATAIAPLSADGWIMMHDRRSPNGGNVDHVLVGPGGVVLLDAKAWVGTLSVSGSQRLRCGDRTKHSSVEAMASLIEIVRNQLPDVPVSGGLVFVGNDSATALPSRLDGVGLCPVERVVEVLRRKPGVVSARVIDASIATLAALLPAMDTVQLVRPEAVDAEHLDLEAVQAIWDHPVSERYRFYVARDWVGYGKKRVYLSDADGRALGWIDTRTGDLHDLPAGSDDPGALLRRLIAPTAIPSPDVSAINPAGRITARILRSLGNDRRGVGHVVAKIWRKGDKRRLYVTLHARGMPPFNVGSVDLMTGALTANDPAMTGLIQHALHVVFDQVAGAASREEAALATG